MAILQGEPDHKRGDDPWYNIDIKDPMPGDLINQKTAQQRPHHRRDAPDAREETLHPRPLFKAKDVADNDKDQRHHPARANALDGAKGNQLPHALRHATQHRANQENAQRHNKDRSPPKNIRKLAINGHRCGRGKHVNRKDPTVDRQTTQLADNGGHGRGNHGRFHRSHKEAQHNPDGGYNCALTGHRSCSCFHKQTEIKRLRDSEIITGNL